MSESKECEIKISELLPSFQEFASYIEAQFKKMKEAGIETEEFNVTLIDLSEAEKIKVE